MIEEGKDNLLLSREPSPPRYLTQLISTVTPHFLYLGPVPFDLSEAVSVANLHVVFPHQNIGSVININIYMWL